MLSCPSYSAQVAENYYFCPNCGKKLKETEVKPTVFGVVWLLVLSTILPPFGIGLTLRYLKSKNTTIKMIGVISIILTIGVLVYALWTVYEVSQNFGVLLNRQLDVPRTGF